jgi:hypothetical protein
MALIITRIPAAAVSTAPAQESSARLRSDPPGDGTSDGLASHVQASSAGSDDYEGVQGGEDLRRRQRGRDSDRTPRAESAYKVGHKQPPLHSRFRPNQTGNPRGRPRGATNIATRIQRELRKVVTVIKNGKPYKMTKGDIIAAQTVDASMNKDMRATVFVTKQEELAATQTEKFVAATNFAMPNKENVKFILSRLSRLAED